MADKHAVQTAGRSHVLAVIAPCAGLAAARGSLPSPRRTSTTGGLQAMRAFSGRTAGPVFGHLLLSLVDLAGVIALAWPGPAARVLVLIVGIWAVIAGVIELRRTGKTLDSALPESSRHEPMALTIR